MPIRDGAVVRQDRIRRLINFIKTTEKDDFWNTKRIISNFSLQTGLTHDRIAQYIQELCEGGILVEEDEKVKTVIGRTVGV